MLLKTSVPTENKQASAQPLCSSFETAKARVGKNSTKLPNFMDARKHRVLVLVFCLRQTKTSKNLFAFKKKLKVGGNGLIWIYTAPKT